MFSKIGSAGSGYRLAVTESDPLAARYTSSGPDRQRHVVTAVAPKTSPETGELS